ncbi:DUF6011 domain-containing protein [Streptomyces nigrescens]|uniref:DUF6011 domain-containing protein n=1 Tax=Streptomyces nigrescens TaxID=1920 RepID=UPI003700553C
MTSRPQQPALLDTSVGGQHRITCQGCRRPLTDPESRARGWGRECDPLLKNQHRNTGVDQDTIPGT